MQLAIVSNGLRVISRGTTDGNAIGLFGADETVRSLRRDELMAEVEEAWRRTPAGVAIPASVAGGTAQSRGGGTAQSLGHAARFIVAQKINVMSISTRIVLGQFVLA